MVGCDAGFGGTTYGAVVARSVLSGGEANVSSMLLVIALMSALTAIILLFAVTTVVICILWRWKRFCAGCC